jgi:hypothetical protein
MWLLIANRWEAKTLVIQLQERTVSRPEEQSINTPIYLVCSVTYVYRTLVQLEWLLIRSVNKLQIYDLRHIYFGSTVATFIIVSKNVLTVLYVGCVTPRGCVYSSYLVKHFENILTVLNDESRIF